MPPSKLDIPYSGSTLDTTRYIHIGKGKISRPAVPVGALSPPLFLASLPMNRHGVLFSAHAFHSLALFCAPVSRHVVRSETVSHAPERRTGRKAPSSSSISLPARWDSVRAVRANASWPSTQGFASFVRGAAVWCIGDGALCPYFSGAAVARMAVRAHASIWLLEALARWFSE